jgi:LacI family transcriptional regulator
MKRKPPLSESASILEVAMKAGVSTATVSRVLNRSAAVAPETVETVMKWVRDLGYELPQRKRRASVRPATLRKQIAIIGIGNPHAAWLDVPAIARAVRAVTRSAREAGYGVLLEEVADPATLAGVFKDGEIAGAVVWLSSTIKAGVLESIRIRLPIVRAMGDQLGTFQFDHVGPNNRQVGALARDYLHAKGCRQMLFLADRPNRDLIQIRADGFFQSGNSDVPEGGAVLVSREPIQTYAGRPAQACPGFDAAAAAILAAGPGPVGVFTATDYEAAGIYPYLSARGAKLGSEVIVVSCDNDAATLSGLSPRPASVDLLSEEIGRKAFAQLLTRINQPAEPPVQLLITPKLAMPEIP